MAGWSRWRRALLLRMMGWMWRRIRTRFGRIERLLLGDAAFGDGIAERTIRIRTRWGPTEFDRAVEEYDRAVGCISASLRNGRRQSMTRIPLFRRDYDYCIACYRCTNICNDWEQAAAITVDGTGGRIRASSPFSATN